VGALTARFRFLGRIFFVLLLSWLLPIEGAKSQEESDWDVLDWNCRRPISKLDESWDTSRDSKSLIIQLSNVEGGTRGTTDGVVYRFKTVQKGRAYLATFGGSCPFFEEQRDFTVEWRCRIAELDQNGVLGLILSGSWFDLRVFFGRASREEKNWILLADLPTTRETFVFPWEDHCFHTYRLSVVASTHEGVLFADGEELGRISLEGNGEPWLTFPDFYPEGDLDVELDFFRVSGKGAFSPDGSSLAEETPSPFETLFSAKELADSNQDLVTEGRAEPGLWSLRKERSMNDRKLCLCADWSSEPSDLLLNPELEGLHQILVGVLLPDVMGQCVKVGLADERGSKLLTGALQGKKWPTFVYERAKTRRGTGVSHTPFYGEFVELDAGVMDLTEKTLRLGSTAGKRTYITHVRLHRLNSSQSKRYLSAQTDGFQKKVVGMLDLLEYERWVGTGTQEDLWDLAASCDGLFSEVAVEVARGAAYFPSETFSSLREGRSDVPLPLVRLGRECHPLQEGIEAFSGRDIAFTARIAMNCQHIGSRYGQFSSRFAETHPAYWERGKDGRPDRDRLCYGHPAVQEEMLKRIEELVELNVEGVALDFSISPPMMRYGDPLVTAFMERTGRNPRDLSPGNPEWKEWLLFRASFLTEFLKLTRQLCDEFDKKLTVRLPDCSRERNLAHGVDWTAWIEEGLVDRILYDPMGPVLEDWQGGTDPVHPRPLLEKATASGIEVLVALPFPAGPPLLDLSTILAPTDHLHGIHSQLRDAGPTTEALLAAKRTYALGVTGVAATQIERSLLLPTSRAALFRMRSLRCLEQNPLP